MAGTVNTSIGMTAYVDLGPAPLLLQASGGNARIVVADALPADKDTPGLIMQAGFPLSIYGADASSHVYAISLAGICIVSATPIYAAGGGGGGGGAVTVANGADVAEGSTTDAAAVPGGAGSLSAKLRTLTAQMPATLGQKASAASLAVAIASDQTIIPVNTPVSKIVTQAPTITAAAYAAGNCIGGLLTFAGMTRANDITGIVQQAGVFCKSTQSGAVDLILFGANPTASTLTDKAPLSIAAIDFDKVLGVAHITDWTSLGTPSFAQALGLAMPFKPASGTTTIYGVLVARSTPTFASTSDVEVYVKALDD
jgi:hypothetical protein